MHMPTRPLRNPVPLLATLLVVALLMPLLAAPADASCRGNGRNKCPVTDTTPPTVSITAPQGGAEVRGVVAVSGTAADNIGVTRVTVGLGSQALQVAQGTSSWSTSVDTAALPDGLHALRAIATDAAGNSSTATLTVNVRNAALPPAPAPTEPTVTKPLQQFNYFYRPAVNASAATLAANHDRFILTKLDEPLRDQLKARGADRPILQYLRFEAIMDNTGLGYTWHNQVAWKMGDWEHISNNHPDWFLLNSQGRRLVAGTGDDAETRFYLMDPAHPGWRKYLVERIDEMQRTFGWEGVFFDNVEASLAKRQRSNGVPAKYPTDAAYQKAVKDLLVYLRSHYFGPQGRPVEANIIETRDDNGPVWHDYLTQLDGAMREGWAINWSDSTYKDEWSWERELQQVEDTQAAGKHMWLVALGSRTNTQRQQFAYGSYLLVAGGNASFRYTHYDRYNEAWDYPNYKLDLGQPLGRRYKKGSVWQRDFERGQVVVDPVKHTASIIVN
jgi:hypothetical protein